MSQYNNKKMLDHDISDELFDFHDSLLHSALKGVRRSGKVKSKRRHNHNDDEFDLDGGGRANRLITVSR
jgi:hypothetical protein